MRGSFRKAVCALVALAFAGCSADRWLKRNTFQWHAGVVEMDLTPCSYNKDMLTEALKPTANVLDLSDRGVVAVLMRGNRVRSLDKSSQSGKVHVVSGNRAGCECWMTLSSVIWDGDRVKGRGVVERATVCLSSPAEFDERFYLPGCCRDNAYLAMLKSKRKLAGPVRVVDGTAVRVRPSPFDVFVWKVTGSIVEGPPAVCWVPVSSVDLDEPDDYPAPY